MATDNNGFQIVGPKQISAPVLSEPVSYTHLDVYKRQERMYEAFLIFYTNEESGMLFFVSF